MALATPQNAPLGATAAVVVPLVATRVVTDSVVAATPPSRCQPPIFSG